jgi:hypothetical protein
MGTPKPVRHYNVGELKSRILNIAQTSIYQVSFTPPAALGSFVDFLGRNITLQDIDNIELLCSEASLPGSSLATHDVTNDYHGVTEKMAYRRIYDDTLDLTFYVDRKYNVIEFFDGWMNYIAGEGSRGASGLDRPSFKSPYVNNRFIYPNQYKCDIFLTKFEKEPYVSGTVMNYTFVSAFPINIVSMPISYEQSQLLKCTVSFSYIRYVRERKFIPVSDVSSNPNAPGIPELKNKDYFGPAFDGNPFTINQKIPGAFAGGALEGEEIINAGNANQTPVEIGLPYVGRNVGPLAPFSGL